MVAFNKFHCFADDLAKKVHNLHTDELKVYQTNTAPNAATHTAYDGTTGSTGPAEITAENGYTAGGIDTQNAVSSTTGTTSVTGVDAVWTASGGSFGPTRYSVLYNNTSAGKQLIGWWDRGSSVTPTAPDTLTTDFGASMFTVA